MYIYEYIHIIGDTVYIYIYVVCMICMIYKLISISNLQTHPNNQHHFLFEHLFPNRSNPFPPWEVEPLAMVVQVHVSSVDHCDSVARHCDLHLPTNEKTWGAGPRSGSRKIIGWKGIWTGSQAGNQFQSPKSISNHIEVVPMTDSWDKR